MKCHYHPGVDAVDKCTMCGKAICSECRLDYDSNVVCKPCAMPLVNFFAPMIGGACSFATSTSPPGKLMKNLEKTVKDRVAGACLSPREDEVRKYVLRWMAGKGKPPTCADIMNGLKLRSPDEVTLAIERLHNADIISVRNGEISSAYPFSAHETRHKVVFNDGHVAYALCAVDALGINPMLGENIVIRSECPNCKSVQSIVVKDGRIVAHDPEETIVFISDEGDCGRVAETCCPFINFFCSEPHLQQWKWKNPRSARGETYTLEEALEYGRQIFGGMLV